MQVRLINYFMYYIQNAFWRGEQAMIVVFLIHSAPRLPLEIGSEFSMGWSHLLQWHIVVPFNGDYDLFTGCQSSNVF